MTTDFNDVILRVTQILDQICVRYLIGGSVATAIYGEPRATEDVDLVVDLRAEHVQPLIDALGDDFYVDRESIHRAIDSASSFNIIHIESVYKVDIFLLAGDILGHERMQHRRSILLRPPDDRAWLSSPEDMILEKLDWYRKGGEVSDRQWRDVLGVFKVQRDNLDRDYLVRKAQQLGLAGLLERATTEAGV